jgi:predicted ATPase
MTDRENLDIMLCGIYRDNEVGPDHPLTANLFPRLGAAANLTLKLKPFGLSHVIDFVADSLKRPVTIDDSQEAHRACDEDLIELSRLILASSHGNPFTVHTVVKALHAASLLSYSFADLRWTWDVDAIRAADLSPDVIDLLVAQIDKLASDTRETLKVAACLGSDAIDPAYLARALGRPVEVVKHALEDAKRAGLVQLGQPAPMRRESLPQAIPTEVEEASSREDMSEVSRPSAERSVSADATFRCEAVSSWTGTLC